MTTTKPTTPSTLPAWFNLDAVHPPETLTEIPALVDAARRVLEAVVQFNREHVAQMNAYYDRNNVPPGEVTELVDEYTGMAEADSYLLLAGTLIEHTVIGGGSATIDYAKELLHRHADLVQGVRSLMSNEIGLAVVGDEEVQV